MHFPLWLLFTLVALLFWGITGITQKLSTNNISTELSFLWYAYAMIGIAVVIVIAVPLDWHVRSKDVTLAIVAGVLNSVGVVTSFAALEKGGKASIVIPLCYLYPLLTVVLAIVFLHESLNRVQVVGIVCALVAAVLLSQETPQEAP
jgi:bacterial/archaeal transporter family protein